MKNNYALKIGIDENTLTQYYLSLHPHCADWNVPDIEEIIAQELKHLAQIGIKVVDIEPGKEIMGRCSLLYTPDFIQRLKPLLSDDHALKPPSLNTLISWGSRIHITRNQTEINSN